MADCLACLRQYNNKQNAMNIIPFVMLLILWSYLHIKSNKHFSCQINLSSVSAAVYSTPYITVQCINNSIHKTSSFNWLNKFWQRMFFKLLLCIFDMMEPCTWIDKAGVYFDNKHDKDTIFFLNFSIIHQLIWM